ncbi:MAG TPA: PilZ domain-containing protein [Smithellaceae bacterium]|nr:PilZ domain-containing protein [Smithellaceae bacterium]
MKQVEILPGEILDLRLDKNDVRKTLLNQIIAKDVIATEQTNPSLNNSHLNHIIIVTYKAPGENTGRLGFEARIEKITEDYQVILRRLNEPAPCDLRVWPRVRLDFLPEVRAFCRDREIQVVDISGGGAHIILRNDDCGQTAIGAVVSMKFVFPRGEVNLEGEVLRIWNDSPEKRHVAVKFTGSHNISQFIY